MNPSEVNATLVFDLEKAQKYFNSNPTKNKIAMASFKVDDTPLLLKLVGRCDSDGFYATAFDGKQNFSVPMDFEETVAVHSCFSTLAVQVQEFVPGWDVNNPMSRENFWLRLNFDHRAKKFKTKSNLPLTTTKSAEKINGLKGKEMVATVEVKAWFNLADEKAGVSLNVLSVNFE